MCCSPQRLASPDDGAGGSRGYDADWIRDLARQQGAWANIPPKRNREDPICFSPYLYRARNLVERLFNKIKQCRRVATRYDKLAANYLAFVNSHQSEFGCALMSPRASLERGASVSVHTADPSSRSSNSRTEHCTPSGGYRHCKGASIRRMDGKLLRSGAPSAGSDGADYDKQC